MKRFFPWLLPIFLLLACESAVDHEKSLCQSTCDGVGQSRCDGEALSYCAEIADQCLQWITLDTCDDPGQICVEDTANSTALCQVAEPAHCQDGQKSGDESDIDCGGVDCLPCANAQSCHGPDDCTSGNCDKGDSNRCIPQDEKSCGDGLLNRDESDIDCGGSHCAPCDNGQFCAQDEDCHSQNCDAHGGLCTAPSQATCTDGLQNQGETAVDCGGPCLPCAPGQGCQNPEDCQSGHCAENLCAPRPSHCDNQLWDGDETALDCGGSCLGCDNGQACQYSADCQSDYCASALGLCDSPPQSCNDGLLNQGESDVDCGGPCAPCLHDALCQGDGDCLAGHCTDAGLCNAPSQKNEGFEGGNLTAFPYVIDAPDGFWQVRHDPEGSQGGQYCLEARGPDMGEIALSLSVRQTSALQFYTQVKNASGQASLSLFIDGVLVWQSQGSTGWQGQSVPILATTSPEDLREIRFRFSGMGPEDSARLDTIDYPDFNAVPAVPTLAFPSDNRLLQSPPQAFEWRGFDADNDPILYQFQLSRDRGFQAPFYQSTHLGAQHSAPFTLQAGIYYWRVRAQDGLDQRLSAWSAIHSFEIDPDAPYHLAWQQRDGGQFESSTVQKLVIDDGGVSHQDGVQYHHETAMHPLTSGQVTTLEFPGMPSPFGTLGATLSITTMGDFDRPDTEYAALQLDDLDLDPLEPGTCAQITTVLAIDDIATVAEDGQGALTILPQMHQGGESCDGIFFAQATLSYQSASGWITTPPIGDGALSAAAHWEKLRWQGQGDIRLRVLDAWGLPLPENILPGNDAGFTGQTIHLWGLSKAEHPQLKLMAQLSPGASLEQWTLVAGDDYAFDFNQIGDTEGWQGHSGSQGTQVRNDGGVLRLNSPSFDEDPHITYALLNPLSAEAGLKLHMRVRTSNLWNDDAPTLYFALDGPEFSAEKRIQQNPTDLSDFTLLTFEIPPQGPGSTLHALRFDPVDGYSGLGGETYQGWTEIDWIQLESEAF